jgi:hypothetical protein
MKKTNAIRWQLVLVVACLAISGCAPKEEPQPEKRLDGLSIEQTVEQHRAHLLEISGVTAIEVGKCNDMPCIQVKVEKKTPLLENQIPRMLETWHVEIVEVVK